MVLGGVDDAGGEPRMGMSRVLFWTGSRINPNQTAAPASPSQPTRDFGRAGRPLVVDLWGA